MKGRFCQHLRESTELQGLPNKRCDCDIFTFFALAPV